MLPIGELPRSPNPAAPSGASPTPMYASTCLSANKSSRNTRRNWPKSRSTTHPSPSQSPYACSAADTCSSVTADPMRHSRRHSASGPTRPVPSTSAALNAASYAASGRSSSSPSDTSSPNSRRSRLPLPSLSYCAITACTSSGVYQCCANSTGALPCTSLNDSSTRCSSARLMRPSLSWSANWKRLVTSAMASSIDKVETFLAGLQIGWMLA
mmetsp:Transcript_20326/g.51485  ORF Transcript_20326/g.51485 Transcript_20326/m.51485 type:complete len:212 (-) Transcript_20326:123-758(-)